MPLDDFHELVAVAFTPAGDGLVLLSDHSEGPGGTGGSARLELFDVARGDLVREVVLPRSYVHADLPAGVVVGLGSD